MSMLSAQRDKLRKVAGELQSVIDGLNKGRITYDGLMDTLNYGIQCLNGAADTIWKLRNDCVDLRLENKKLRELCVDLYLCSDETCTDCEYRDYSGEGFWCKRGIGWKRVRMRELGIEVKP